MMATIQCHLCPRSCLLRENQIGACGARKALGCNVRECCHGLISALHNDPVEKKPLHHFYPGSRTLSIGGFGCNLMCRGCQNFDISRRCATDGQGAVYTPEQIVQIALQHHAHSIAYTYNEPIVWWEFMDETAECAHHAGLKNIMVTAGYLCENMYDKVFRHIDAANVDLKGFDDTFYQNWANGRLQPVLDTLTYLHQKQTCWLEITTLLIPGQNDAPQTLSREFEWIHDHLGDDVPLHLSAFFPRWKALDIPSTPESTLYDARQRARDAGLHFVYLGNIMEPAVTCCPHCGEKLIERTMSFCRNYLDKNRCIKCHEILPGQFV